jgi:hypothetical protein
MEEHMADMVVAQTILEQLGGHRFRVMTGAKNFIGDVKALSFRLPGSGFAKDGVNFVRITLNALDTYDMEFGRVRGRNVKMLYTESGIYADKLQTVFTRVTGLNTSLGTMGIPAAAMRQFNNRHED